MFKTRELKLNQGTQNCWRRIHRNGSGQSLVEFALVLPLLLTTLFGIFGFGRFYFTKLTLQHAVIEATRLAVTGNVLTDPETGEPIDRASSIVRVIPNNTTNLDGFSFTPTDGGGPEEIIRIHVDFRNDLTMPLVQTIVPDGSIDLSLSTAMRNEASYE